MLTTDEEEYLTSCLRAELVEAKSNGATDGQLVSAFLEAMAEVSVATLRVKVDYPNPKKRRPTHATDKKGTNAP